MVHRAPGRVRGPRPPLGTLLRDDGASFRLESDCSIGCERDPETPVVHARVVLCDWDVQIENVTGTSIRPPGADAWCSLAPGEASIIHPGTRIKVGDREFLFDSYHLG